MVNSAAVLFAGVGRYIATFYVRYCDAFCIQCGQTFPALDFHVRFERIRPYEDCNGRVGRLLMLKECLRHGIVPFIIDDKCRGAYNRGIAAWSEDHEPLISVSLEAQKRFQGKMELCALFQYARYPEPCRGGKP